VNLDALVASLSPRRPLLLVETETVQFATSVVELSTVLGQFISVDEFACDSKACAPPPIGTGGSRSTGRQAPARTGTTERPLRSGSSSPVRIQTGAAAKRTGRKEALGKHAGLEHFESKIQEKMVKDFARVTGLTHLKTARDVVDHLKEETRRQVEDAMKRDPELTSRFWYDAANRVASELSEDLGAPSAGLGSALLAVTSPQTPWYDNIGMAKEIGRLWKENKPIPAKTLGDAYDDANNIEMAKFREKMTREQFIEAFSKETWRTIRTDIGGGILKSHFQFSDPPVLALDQELIPNGNGEFRYKTLDGRIIAKSGLPGKKALDILHAFAEHGESDEFYENVSIALGDGSKVRSFYNNINDPDSADYVTIDTHAAAGMTGFPGGTGQPFIRGVMTGGGVDEGMSQSYALYQQAISEVAKEFGLLPREVQSITWVQQRDVEWPDKVKSAYTNSGSDKRPQVSFLQYQIAISRRGPEGVRAGRQFRDRVAVLLRERPSANAKRTKEINSELSSLIDSLGLSVSELQEARAYSAPVGMIASEKKKGIKVPADE
jgi:hypothetical protein